MNAQSFGRILFFIVFAILLAVLVIYFTRPSLPIRRVIQNTEGKSIDAVINGKINDTVYFIRMPDREEFSLTLDKLSFRDRVLLTILKEQAPPPPPSKADPIPPEFSDNYIKNREKKIIELQSKLEVMNLELNSRTLGEMMENAYARRIAVHEREIRELEVAIETYRYRLKKRN